MEKCLSRCKGVIAISELNIFQWYINGDHVFSWFAVIASVLIGMYILRKQYPIYLSFMMSLSVAAFSTNIYEIIFNSILYFGKINVGYIDPSHFGGVFSFVLGAIASGTLIIIIHLRKPFITFQYWKYVCLGFIAFLICLIAMYYTNFFNNLALWLFYQKSDPHNWLWALSKTLGFLIFIPLVKRKRTSAK